MQKYSLVPKVRVLSIPKRPVVEMVLPVAQEILDASGLQILGQVEIASSVLPSFSLVLLLTRQPAKLV